MRDGARWIPAGLLILGCVFTLGINRQRATALLEPLDSIPMTLGGRALTVGTIPADQRQVAGVSTYLYRYATDEPAQFDVYVGYYDQQTQGKTIHSPKNCLPGAGWEALQQTTTRIDTGNGSRVVNRYLLQNKQRRALVFYWYQGRGRVAANEYQVKWELLRDAAVRGRTEEALVRITVYLDGNTDEAAATQQATRIAADLIPAMDQVLPTL